LMMVISAIAKCHFEQRQQIVDFQTKAVIVPKPTNAEIDKLRSELKSELNELKITLSMRK